MSTDLYQALTVTPEEGAPLIFAFHGTGGDENQFFDLAKHLAPGAGVNSEVRCNIVGGFDIRLLSHKETMLPCQDIVATESDQIVLHADQHLQWRNKTLADTGLRRPKALQADASGTT
jgi:hypothetical protein